MPLQATSGAASYDGFGGGVVAEPNYIESCFSTYLYTGNATTGQSINNGIDLATKGGLLWCKNRTTASTPHYLFDTARDFSYSNAAVLNTASTAAQEDKGTDYAKPETNGFSFGSGAGTTSPNKNGDSFASWTFRKQPKFFDVVTWTGTGSNTTISHSLGSVPACIMVKRTDTTGAWQVYHRSLANTEYLVLNTTAAKATGTTRWNSTTPTSTVFSLGTDATVNASGGTYVAYIFAHDAGGFGLTGTDNVISCGTYTGNGTIQTVSLGYEPQWVLVKNASSGARGYGSSWAIQDNMRGFPANDAALSLYADRSDSEDTNTVNPNATGFSVSSYNVSGDTYIYIAIRRGPMKVPTDGTSVFAPVTLSSSGNLTSTANFPIDLIFYGSKSATDKWYWFDRLRGTGTLQSNSTAAEDGPYPTNFASNVNFQQTGITGDFSSYISYDLRRAPSFFDEVCYTGTGSARTVTHNLQAVPELMIVKTRSLTERDWVVYSSALGATKGFYLNQPDAAVTSSTFWNNTTPTSSVFTVNTSGGVNLSAATYVAYLFATCAGVSKVFSYTGNGSSQTINCGFTGGARFVLIKRTDFSGDWYVWDSARGIVSGNDPHLSLNTTSAEVTTDDTIDTDSTGFVVNQVSATDVNVSSATYIGLAIA
jgi:hypothetical protein